MSCAFSEVDANAHCDSSSVVAKAGAGGHRPLRAAPTATVADNTTSQAQGAAVVGCDRANGEAQSSCGGACCSCSHRHSCGGAAARHRRRAARHGVLGAHSESQIESCHAAFNRSLHNVHQNIVSIPQQGERLRRALSDRTLGAVVLAEGMHKLVRAKTA